MAWTTSFAIRGRDKARAEGAGHGSRRCVDPRGERGRTEGKVVQRVERSFETGRAAGSIPAGHAFGFVAQQQSRRLLIGVVQVRLLPEPCTRKGCHGCGTPSRKRVGLTALGVRLPPLPLHVRSGVVETERRATVNREAQVRAVPPELFVTSGRRGAWPPRRLRAPEIAGSTPAGQT